MILQGDSLTVLKTLPDKSVNCCVTSPPYWGLRDYGVDGQLGLEKTPEEYVSKMVGVFREVKRVLLDDGTLWLNLGDSYVGGGRGGRADGSCKQATNKGSLDTGPTGKIRGMKPKDLVGIPWMVAFALRADGWYLRSDIIWSKPNVMPESVTDRPTKSHEYIFLMSKSAKYFYDADAIKEPLAPSTVVRCKTDSITDNNVSKRKHFDKLVPSINPNTAEATRQKLIENGNRNKRSVWTVTTKPFSEAHFATFPEELITPCVLAGCPQGGVVLDPFFGAGTTGVVAKSNRRNYIGIELNPEYIKIAKKRLLNTQEIVL